MKTSISSIGFMHRPAYTPNGTESRECDSIADRSGAGGSAGRTDRNPPVLSNRRLHAQVNHFRMAIRGVEVANTCHAGGATRRLKSEMRAPLLERSRVAIPS